MQPCNQQIWGSLPVWNISLYTILWREEHQHSWFKPHSLKFSDFFFLSANLHIQASFASVNHQYRNMFFISFLFLGWELSLSFVPAGKGRHGSRHGLTCSPGRCRAEGKSILSDVRVCMYVLFKCVQSQSHLQSASHAAFSCTTQSKDNTYLCFLFFLAEH